MDGKKIVALLMLIVLECYSQPKDHEKYKKDDHSFMFNKSLSWLIKPTPEELKFIINQNKFKRFSLTKEDSTFVFYEASEDKNIDSAQLNDIFRSILIHRKKFEKKNKAAKSRPISMERIYRKKRSLGRRSSFCI